MRVCWDTHEFARLYVATVDGVEVDPVVADEEAGTAVVDVIGEDGRWVYGDHGPLQTTLRGHVRIWARWGVDTSRVPAHMGRPRLPASTVPHSYESQQILLARP